MRLLGAIAAIVALTWSAYLASPYWAAWRFANAVAARDIESVVPMLNLQALRSSFVKQLLAGGLQGTELEKLESRPSGLAAGTAALALAPVMAGIATPGLVADLARPTDTAGQPTGLFGGSGLASRLEALLAASRWRGFRNVYFHVPPGAEPERRLRLQWRFSRLRWRLISLDLPPHLQGQVARRVAAALGRVVPRSDAPRP